MKKVKIEDNVQLNYQPNSLKTLPLLKIGNNSVIRSYSVIYAGSKIGNNFHCGHHVLIRENNIIGNKVSIGSGSIVEFNVNIEDECRLHSNTYIPEFTKLEKGCWIGPNVCITNAKYPNNKLSKKKISGVTVGKKAIIGANSTILPGVEISEGSIIGAGSVVTKTTEPFKIYAGNPAKIINIRSNIKDYFDK